ncbi:hypothetical protein OEG84_19685 [Hoeflea sp. G2-23]|uniref:Phage portal protein n=1 Tax=Hoeflea algicola TaxID=2983763 RepID=A0ABT3ZDK0_9HYPH|nr:hypothetical protein [Hoeflea algicola]MCY0149860.1 hypothetical protein [Hoeflea algicola]
MTGKPCGRLEKSAAPFYRPGADHFSTGEKMTTMTSRAVEGAHKPFQWNRTDHLLYGQRFYSNPRLAAWLARKPLPVAKSRQLPLSPESAAAKWISLTDIDRIEDGDDEATTGRYITITERLHRLHTIAQYFAAICDGRIVPTRYPCKTGALVWMPNDGPTDPWREWAEMVWASMPANDSEIFARAATTESPRLAHLAPRLQPTLAWRRMSTPISFCGTNWHQPDNDNYKEGEEQPASNRERRIRPGSTYAELRSLINKAGPTIEWRHAKLGGGGSLEQRPVDLTWQTVPDKTNRLGVPTKSHQTVVRAGKLRIANGKTEYRGTRVDEGTILYQPDKFGEMLGPEPDLAEKVRSASYWSALFKVDRETVVATDKDGNEKLRFITGGKMRRTVLITVEEQQALLAGPLPPITYCPDGLPRGSEDIKSQFVGGWISQTKGKAPLERWEDVADELARQGEFDRQIAALPPEQAKAMNLATTAANLQEIGEAFGKVGKNAERHGKKVLIAANDNLKKIVAAA